MPSSPQKKLETFPNPMPAREYHIHMEIPEFSCLCPKTGQPDFRTQAGKTGQPDFATLILDYIPDKKCIELKSLKLYIWSYRNEGVFHEAVTNLIVDDLVVVLKPRYLRLTAKFFVRGGIFTNVVVDYRKSGWKPLPIVELSRLESQSTMRE